jgi:hypothetical protein
MVNVQTHEVDAQIAPVNVRPYSFVYWQSDKWQFLWKAKNTNVEEELKLEFLFCFIETTHDRCTDKWSLMQ